MAIKKLILDLDMGVDDAMALAYAIASPEVELVGITTCFGNVRVEQSAHNCLAVLDLLGRPEVPVYLGADRPPCPTLCSSWVSLCRTSFPLAPVSRSCSR